MSDARVTYSKDWNPTCRDCDRHFDDCNPTERIHVIFTVWVCTDCYDGELPQPPLELYTDEMGDDA